VYQFKHALIRDAAYESLLKSKRQRYHQQIAQVLLEKFDDVAGAQPELVAQHYTAAGLNERAVPHWQRAGEKAIERSANVEAISHLRKGLTLLKPLPETQQRTEQELDLLTALGTALMAVKGFGAQEVKQTLDRARELCGQVGETPKLFEVLHGLWIFYLTKAELKTSQEIAEQLLSLAQRFQDPASLLEAHHVLGANFFGVESILMLKRTSNKPSRFMIPSRKAHAYYYPAGKTLGSHVDPLQLKVCGCSAILTRR
jgi:hypothetical protein